MVHGFEKKTWQKCQKMWVKVLVSPEGGKRCWGCVKLSVCLYTISDSTTFLLTTLKGPHVSYLKGHNGMKEKFEMHKARWNHQKIKTICCDFVGAWKDLHKEQVHFSKYTTTVSRHLSTPTQDVDLLRVSRCLSLKDADPVGHQEKICRLALLAAFFFLTVRCH